MEILERYHQIFRISERNECFIQSTCCFDEMMTMSVFVLNQHTRLDINSASSDKHRYKLVTPLQHIILASSQSVFVHIY